jgi:glucose-1-phosphate thymidylyltransferase
VLPLGLVALGDALAAGSQGAAGLRYLGVEGPLDVAGALTLAEPVIGDAPCVVHLANGLLGEPLGPLLERANTSSPSLTVLVQQQSAAEERLSAASQQLLHVAELDPQRTALGLAGILVLGSGAVHHCAGASWGAAGDLDITTVAARIAAAGGELHLQLVDGWRRYDGAALDLLELNRIALDRLQGNRKPSNNSNRIEGRVEIHETAFVSSSVIVGPTVIGPGAHISDSYIGPYTSVGTEVRIEGSEIERSIIASGASVMHVGGRLVASVVGRDARVFRDFSLPRALRLRVGEGTEVALS